MHTETWHFDEGEFAVHRVGEGPPLLLIHGIGPGTAFQANFSAVVPTLARHRTLYGIDLIGFGASPAGPDGPRFDFARWVRQAAAAVARIGVPQVDVWGQSLGAAIALALAASSPAVRRVVATGAGGGGRWLNAALDAFWTAPADLAALRVAMQGAVFDASVLRDEQLALRLQALVRDGRGADFEAMMASGKAHNLRSCWLAPELLSTIRAPVLLIHGREDRPVPYRESALHLFDHLGDARLVLLGRCGHNPMLEHTAAVCDLALQHLTSTHD